MRNRLDPHEPTSQAEYAGSIPVIGSKFDTPSGIPVRARRLCRDVTQNIDFDEMNRRVIAEFRETGGKAGGVFEGKPLVLVHHVGAKSGKERIAPLVPYLDDEQRIFIFASKGGADTNPDWYHNLVANPHTVAELGTETFPVTVRVLTGQERDVVYAKQATVEPQFAEYQRKTSRVIPVLELQR
jgi:deazaflavin-dependent oxidoreductase (nitroreductase family)